MGSGNKSSTSVEVTEVQSQALSEAMEFIKYGIFHYAMLCAQDTQQPRLEDLRKIGREGIMILVKALAGADADVDQHVRVTASHSPGTNNFSAVMIDFEGLTDTGLEAVRLYTLGESVAEIPARGMVQ